MSYQQWGFPTDRGMSYAKIEQIASNVLRVVAPDRPATEALPGLSLFERLHLYRVPFKGKMLSLDYEVIDLPSRVEAFTRYDEENEEVLVTLSSSTYDHLEKDYPRARLTVCHEIGHAVLHVRELVRLSRIPHRNALFRGEEPSHERYQDTEWQANAFASALLVPARGLAVLEQQGNLRATTIQKQYQVSALAAKVRLGVYERKIKGPKRWNA